MLTPLAVDPGHPFPYISTLSLSIAVGLRDPETGEKRFARVKIPPILPRLFAVERDKFVLLDQVIEANLDELFRGMEILETHLFRVTRDADIAIEEDEADDLLLAIEEEIRRRRFGEAVRLEVERSMPELTRQILIKGTGVRDEDAFEVAGMLDLTALWQLVSLDRPDLKAPVHSPVIPQRLLPPDEDEPTDVFAQMRAGDIFVHHPYESFTASTERFIDQAADDPEVLTIKQTLYRTSGESPIVGALIRAAESGKQVVVLVEIKARFDEENNIVWARRLEQAGAHVVYGLVGLKTHSKVALVVRREGSGLRRYVHIGTGNYNGKTARLYTDLGLLTCREELGADVTDLFNVLTGLSRQRVFRRLLVAPMTMRTRFIEMVEREAANARAGHPARIVLKVNSLVDVQVIEALYEASRAGVEIDLIVRGACCLVPGVEGVSERIRVRSIIGEFLEHSRIWMFSNGGRRRVVHGLRRPHGAQPGPAGRGGDAGRGPRGPGPPRPDHRGPPRRRPALVAAGARRALGTHGGPRVPRGDGGDLRGPQGGRRDRERARRHPAPAACERRLDGPAGMTDTDGAGPLEIELKYRMTDAATGDRLLAADDLAGLAAAAPAETVVHEDRYVDTPDGALAAAGYAGRFRSSGDETIITLKGLRRQDDGGAAHRREELEGPADLESAAPAWPESAARDAVISIVGEATLGELVRVRQVRRKRDYAANGTVVELSVDDVEVVMGDRVIERFAELEVELRQGDEAALEPLVDLLSEIEELRSRRDVQARTRHGGRAPRGRAGRWRAG